MFGRRENAIGELKAVLPAALLAQLDLSTLQASPKSFVDERDLEPTALEAIRPHLPNFKIVLDDLVQQQDGDLRRREAGVLGRMALLLLKHLREVRRDAASFQGFLQSVADLVLLLPGGEERTLVMSYIMEVVEGADPEAVTAALGKAAIPEVLEDVMTGAEKLRQEGRVAARRSDVTRLLHAKVPGQITAEIQLRIEVAQEAALEDWFDRALSATSLEDVLRPA